MGDRGRKFRWWRKRTQFPVCEVVVLRRSGWHRQGTSYSTAAQSCEWYHSSGVEAEKHNKHSLIMHSSIFNSVMIFGSNGHEVHVQFLNLYNKNMLLVHWEFGRQKSYRMFHKFPDTRVGVPLTMIVPSLLLLNWHKEKTLGLFQSIWIG